MGIKLKKYPLPIAGLILGLAALGNLVQAYGEGFRTVLGVTASILLLIFVAKLVIYPKQVGEDLHNPVVASVFPTFSMALMVLSTYVKPTLPIAAYAIWLVSVILHFSFIIWFSVKFLRKFKIEQVFPSWYIVYVGIVVASVTGPVYGMMRLGQFAFWFGFASYIMLLYIVVKRTITIKMPEATRPTLAIFAAPASLLLTGYMNTFVDKNMTMLYLLMALSFVFFAAVLSMLPTLLRLKFYPSYSGFTFPLIISAMGMKLANVFLINTNQVLPLLNVLVVFQVTVAVVVTLFVLFRYIQFLLEKEVPTNVGV